MDTVHGPTAVAPKGAPATGPRWQASTEVQWELTNDTSVGPFVSRHLEEHVIRRYLLPMAAAAAIVVIVCAIAGVLVLARTPPSILDELAGGRDHDGDSAGVAGVD